MAEIIPRLFVGTREDAEALCISVLHSNEAP